ncbi:Mpv17 / PMP22 family protein [Desulfonispora thiosulfatigenes DSM 11270]|uniref:Mpv17 / PMP22 family protein n=1 Tax=Desulfonispora thiosulfatigenes DSM 11270 TaxID=656914 RepID=A0A1W1ULH0_DESTI|nr:hypothetical protein [Desulfonispora thiosulfatigenes]SMB81863.1 Mpv17 / PMP22 family protein [Desulfonispora thiosulfatigenes DSM 11270]
MKKGDLYWILAFVLFATFVIFPTTHEIFVNFTTNHPYIGGFFKFGILATMGELLAIRISTRDWKKPSGLIYRAIIWGLLGVVITLMFQVFAVGVKGALASGYLPGGDSAIAFAFLVSTIMNLFFAPIFMAFHRYTDTYIDLYYEGKKNITVDNVVSRIDWTGFVSFVILKTVPFFWIPAHTVTFMLPPEYRVLMAAFLSIALGAILAFAKKKK